MQRFRAASGRPFLLTINDAPAQARRCESPVRLKRAISWRALSDPDALPATEAQLARARRIPSVRALRRKLGLSQAEFAARFHLPLGTIRDWEQGAHRPDKAAQVLLTVIASDPDMVARALKS
jgi:putative transcriptional regulator